ncbi:MAG: phospholipase A [Salinimicrobium sp.]
MRPPKIIFALLIFASLPVFGQGLSREQVKDTVHDMPVFSMYEDNYFMTGIPLHRGISKTTADAKYQISFKYLLTRNTLPYDSYLFFTYTQKAFWDIYDKSLPFNEINFNPGINLGIPVFKKDELLGMAFLKAEHESNGRDSIYSRSWNRISLAFHMHTGKRSTLSVEAWFPFRYKKDNPELIDYAGFGELNYSYELQPEKWTLDVRLQKGGNWDWKGSVRTRLLYSPFAMKRINLMLEWYYGYAESLIAFQQLRSMVRVGFMFRSDELNFL